MKSALVNCGRVKVSGTGHSAKPATIALTIGDSGGWTVNTRSTSTFGSGSVAVN